MIYTSIEDLVGNTPLLELVNLEKEYHLECSLIAKLEYYNPAGSVKDRVAREMIEQAEKQGVLKKGYTIIEATSGNTGVGLAAIGVSKGYSVIIVMPDTMSIERRRLITAYGGTVVLTDGKKGMKMAIAKAEELAQTIPNAVIMGQFDNPANPEAHRKTTALEIWNDMNGKVDIFVAGVGTGGTITGVGEVLKEKNPDIKIIAVEPDRSPVLSTGVAGSHRIQGIGAGFVPSILNREIYDEVIRIKDEEAFAMGKTLGRMEGILVGISSSAAVCAAIEVARRVENKGKNIVVLLPDTGQRYLSMEIWD